MPSTSPAQKHTMAAIAHGWQPDNPQLAKIPVSVAKDFNAADQKADKRKKLAQAMMARK